MKDSEITILCNVCNKDITQFFCFSVEEFDDGEVMYLQCPYCKTFAQFEDMDTYIADKMKDDPTYNGGEE